MSKETYEALEEAIRAHTASETEGDYAVDWVVGIAAVHAGSESGTNYGYNLSGGYQQYMPTHRVIGLIEVIKDMVRSDDD